jgi:hypothetical protein
VLVWLASYPRSGSTYVRMLLKAGFDLESTSLHGDADARSFGSDAVTALVGHVEATGSRAQAIAAAQADPGRLRIIKTHEGPATNDPAIFVVRDGRSAVVSYYHFLNDVEGIPTRLTDVVEGRVFAGSWSDHYIAWQPAYRPHTLLLRYEEITRDPAGTIAQLASFLRITALGTEAPGFATLKLLNPRFFRAGNDARNLAEMSPYEELFRSHHQPVMNVLGYS